MNELLKLTEDEHSKVVDELCCGQARSDLDRVVNRVIAAINKVRGGDPVGTIRRAASGQVVAIRVQGASMRGPTWQCTYIDGGTVGVSPYTDPSGWPLVYAPEVS